MNAYYAMMAAADQIEKYPNSYCYNEAYIPKDHGPGGCSQGCMIGWVGHFLDEMPEKSQVLNPMLPISLRPHYGDVSYVLGVPGLLLQLLTIYGGGEDPAGALRKFAKRNYKHLKRPEQTFENFMAKMALPEEKEVEAA